MMYDLGHCVCQGLCRDEVERAWGTPLNPHDLGVSPLLQDPCRSSRVSGRDPPSSALLGKLEASHPHSNSHTDPRLTLIPTLA